MASSYFENLRINGSVNIQRSTSASKSRLLSSLVIMVFLLAPIYIFGSGGLQLVDIPIFLLSVYIIFTLYEHEVQLLSLISIPLFAFTLWSILINMMHYLYTYEVFYIKSSVQIMYIAAIFFAFTVLFLRISAYKGENIVSNYIFAGILLSLLVPLVLKGNPESGLATRQTLSFNNSNQLAGHTVIILAIILVLHNHLEWNTRKGKNIITFGLITVFILSHYYIFISASRSGFASLILINIIALYKYRNKVLLPIAIPAIGILIISSSLVSVEDLSASRLYERFVREDIYSAMAKRTAGRFNYQDLSIVFGAGKTSESLGMKEIHNTFLDVVYSYGLIGGSLFAFFMYLYLKTCMKAKYYILLIFSILPIGMSHNLIRSRMLWIFLALVLSINLMRVQNASLLNLNKKDKLMNY